MLEGLDKLSATDVQIIIARQNARYLRLKRTCGGNITSGFREKEHTPTYGDADFCVDNGEVRTAANVCHGVQLSKLNPH